MLHLKALELGKLAFLRHDTQYNDIKLNDTHHKRAFFGIQHYNSVSSIVILESIFLMGAVTKNTLSYWMLPLKDPKG